jgi:hypothetical protein
MVRFLWLAGGAGARGAGGGRRAVGEGQGEQEGCAMMPAVLLAVALLRADAPEPSTVRTWSLATLTAQQAQAIVGKRARFTIELDSPATEVGGYLAYACRSSDPSDERGVYLFADQVVGEDEVDVLVEGELHLVRHDAWGQVPAFKAYVVRNAVRIRPR